MAWLFDTLSNHEIDFSVLAYKPHSNNNLMVDEERQCTATAKSTGERCKRAAIKGGEVCPMHGGSAPQVKKKAQDRLDEMADSVTANVQADIEDLQEEYDNTDDPEEKLAIVGEMRKLLKLVLDRTGHGPSEKREITGEGGGGIVIDLGDE